MFVTRTDFLVLGAVVALIVVVGLVMWLMDRRQ
jgi:hypothetical protein